MATASPNNHTTTRELILILSPALNLLMEPMTTKANNSKTIENTKSKLPTQIQLKIMQPNIKPCIWICVKLEQKFLLENQYTYFLLDSFNSQWVDNGNLTLAFDHGLWFWKLIICDLFELFVHLFSCPTVGHIQSYWFWIRFKWFVWKFQYT